MQLLIHLSDSLVEICVLGVYVCWVDSVLFNPSEENAVDEMKRLGYVTFYGSFILGDILW